MSLEDDIKDFIIERIGAVRCVRCFSADLTLIDDALICPHCKTEHRSNSILRRYPVKAMEDHQVNWKSYDDNRRAETQVKDTIATAK